MPRITEHPKRPTRHHDQRRSDRGSATMLVPVGVLILMFLAAIAVDLSAVHMAQRNLQDVLSSAADDAASSLDRDQIRLGEQVVIEQADAARIATAEVMSANLPGDLVGPIDVVVVSGGTAIEVRARLRVPHIFSILPRADRTTDVAAVGRASNDVQP